MSCTLIGGQRDPLGQHTRDFLSEFDSASLVVYRATGAGTGLGEAVQRADIDTGTDQDIGRLLTQKYRRRRGAQRDARFLDDALIIEGEVPAALTTAMSISVRGVNRW